MDSVIDTSRPAELPPMVEFWSTVTLGGRSFTGNVQPQGVVRGITRKRCRGHVGHPAGFDLTASEMAHDGR